MVLALQGSTIQTTAPTPSSEESIKKFAEIQTNQCLAGQHNNCPGKNHHGVFIITDESMQELALMFFAGVRCPCGCHQNGGA